MDTVSKKKVPAVINPPVMMATKDNIEKAITWEVNDALVKLVEGYKY